MPEKLRCAHCARSGEPAELAAGWVLSTPPRAVGDDRPRNRAARVTMLCPDCARRCLRDLEARVDP